MNNEADTPPDAGTARGWALAGSAAALSALAIGALTAALTVPRASPLSAVADVVISASPEAVTQWGISTFGTADKPLLQLGLAIGVTAFGALVGLLWRRSLGLGGAAIVVFAILGVWAALTRPSVGALAALPSLVAAAWTAGALFAWGKRRAAAAGDRRRFLATVAGIGVAALAAGWLANRFGPASVEADRAAVDLPPPDEMAPAVGPNTDFDVRGLSSWHTPNDSFYLIDTAITKPTVDLEEWRLRIHGMVDRERTYTFDDLLGRELIERDLTLCCVSNPVGGPLVGNARWLGVSLAELIAEAGPHPGADQLVSRSIDGWTAGTPTDAVFDGRDALVAVGMNGVPLPLDHGWPARLVIPGLYGYVSATKWLVELELTTFDSYDAYWIQRDWGLPAPVKTAARIDVPGDSTGAGTVTVAGVAWAQQRGISAVEVQVDSGPWIEAELSDVPSGDTWRQWRLDWDARPGDHTITVRAVDGDGVVQTAAEAGSRPDGATGHHSVGVSVS